MRNLVSEAFLEMEILNYSKVGKNPRIGEKTKKRRAGA